MCGDQAIPRGATDYSRSCALILLLAAPGVYSSVRELIKSAAYKIRAL